MISPRWTKVLRDLWSNKARTILVIASIGIGVFAVGLVMALYAILLNDLNADYLSANPHGAIIYPESFDDDVVEIVKRMPEVGAAEGRASITATVAGATKKIPISIQRIPAVDQMQIDTIRYEGEGAFPPLGLHEIYIERSGASAIPAREGDTITVTIGENRQRELRVAGIVHDVTGFSYAFSQQLSGFVNEETLTWLGGEADYNQLYITVARDQSNEAHVNRVAQNVAEKIEKGGREVYYTFVYQPGQHPIGSFVAAMLTLLGGLGVLAVFLSAFLVVNTMNALLSQHIRQIGMMKAIGADSNQLIGMYIGLVLSYGAIAFLIAAPLSGYLAYSLASALASFLNFNLLGFRFIPVAVVLQLIVALLVPLAAAAGPVISGTRLTVREAISNYGLSAGQFGKSLVDRMVESIRFLSRPLLISLRNTFRRKTRLALTLFTLTLGGAIFIAIFNIRTSIVVEINKTLGYFLSDINVSLDKQYRIKEIEQIALRIPDVTAIEGWGISTGQLMSSDDKTSVQVLLWAPPAGSALIKPVMTAGRWLLPEDQNALVVGNHLLKKRPDLKVGDAVTIKIKGKESKWQIVGTYVLTGNVEPPFVYANNEYLAKMRDEIDLTSEFRVITASQDALTETRVGKALEKMLKDKGINATGITTGSEIRVQQAQQIDVLIYALMAMAILIALVGGLGLMGTMSMNVMERTREIGVMRSIGASDLTILGMVIFEGLLIGVMSWLLGALLAIPISKVLGDAVGYSLLTVPLNMTFSFDGFIIWLIVVLIISTLASFMPARNAVRLTVRDVLAYE